MIMEGGRTGFSGFASQNGASSLDGPSEPSKEKENNSEFLSTSSTTETSERMSDMPENEDWRAFYEHPLTAATTAMLNVNGGDDQAAGIGLLYEYYKMPGLDKPDKHVIMQELWNVPLTSVVEGQSTISAPHDAKPKTNGNSEGPLPSAIVFFERGSPSNKEPQDLSCNKSKADSSPAPKDPEQSDKDGKKTPNIKETKTIGSDNLPPLQSIKVEPEDSPMENSNELPRIEMIVAGDQIQNPDGTTTIKIGTAGNLQTFQALTYQRQGSPYGIVATATGFDQYGNLQTTQGYPSTLRSDQTIVYASPNDYYREYYGTNACYSNVRQTYVEDNSSFVERCMRQTSNHKTNSGLTVDLPSPDSGIGESSITPRENASLIQMFEYSDMTQVPLLPTEVPSSRNSSSRRTSQDTINRSPLSEKIPGTQIHIPKIISSVGFRYYLESPISTSLRKEDDRITYINKGQFYGITLDYIPDPEKPLKNSTVKSVVMVVFREEKTPEDEIKAWQFWHSRQHSIKQRIMDADTKNSTGLVGCIEEVAHNAIAVYWNPTEGPAKINVAVQCLSTDFSGQKGVKGLPLHIQIDTFDDIRDVGPPVHRGYCQIRVFCDKGAERKTRDEERRATKRKLTATGRGKIDEMYHPACDRSEFYSMSDLLKPPVLFTPSDDLEKLPPMEITSFYQEDSASTIIKKEEPIEEGATPIQLDGLYQPKRSKLNHPPPSDRVLIYVRQESETIFNALHLVPPTLLGLMKALAAKYQIDSSKISNFYKQSKKGIVVKMDDDIIKHYSNEDTFIIEIKKDKDDNYDIYLTEL